MLLLFYPCALYVEVLASTSVVCIISVGFARYPNTDSGAYSVAPNPYRLSLSVLLSGFVEGTSDREVISAKKMAVSNP